MKYILFLILLLGSVVAAFGRDSAVERSANTERAVSLALRKALISEQLTPRTKVCVAFGPGLKLDEGAVIQRLRDANVKLHRAKWCNARLRGIVISILSPIVSASNDTYGIEVEVGDLSPIDQGECFVQLLKRGKYFIRCAAGFEPEVISYQQTCCPEDPHPGTGSR